MKQLSFVLVSLGLAACGDNGALAPDAKLPTSNPPRAVVVAGDFKAAGVLTTLDPVTQEVKTNVAPAMAVGNDPMLRRDGHELFVINRAENNITILDDQSFALVEQLGTGADSNPQDVAVVGTKLYVPTYGTKGVTVLTRGSTATKLIDLSAEDPDGKPNCESAFTVGTDVYVACQLLDGFTAKVAGKVYVIDSKTDTVQPARTVTLLHKNPFSLFERIPDGAPHGGDLVLSTVEDFVAPGCVERFTPGTTASSCWVSNVELGGFATRAAFDASARITFFAVPTKYPAADLLAFDMPTDLLWAGALNPMTQAIGDVAVCPSGDTVVFDASMTASGLRMYSGAAELTKAPLPIGIGNGFFSTHGILCY